MTIELVPVIMTPSPFEAMVGWLNDPEVVRYSEQRHKIHTIKTQFDYIESFEFTPNIFRMIIADDTFIGTITANIDTHNSVADVGILIGHKASWGKGYGTQAWTMFCNSLFKGGIRKIEAGCMNNNGPMMTICVRYGMIAEALRVDHFLTEDGAINMMLWGKLREAV